jgi:Sec-independent protein secretion pathway component TatC
LDKVLVGLKVIIFPILGVLYFIGFTLIFYLLIIYAEKLFEYRRRIRDFIKYNSRATEFKLAVKEHKELYGPLRGVLYILMIMAFIAAILALIPGAFSEFKDFFKEAFYRN